jgi:phenylacetate-coenzyme A ligase PaaK-like adenylate-forming protein
MGVTRIIALMAHMLHVEKRGAEAVASVQEKRLRKLLFVAAERSAFYRELYRGIDLATCKLADLPVVTKPQMMAHYDEFVTDPALTRVELRAWLADKSNLGKLFKGRFIAFQTSGTTGENALVVYDRKAMDFVHATVMARHARPGTIGLFDQVKMVAESFVEKHRFAAIVMDGGPYPAFTVALYSPKAHDIFVEQTIISLMDPIDTIVAKLNEFQPHSLFSYPSTLGILAREQLAGRLNLTLNHPASQLTTGSEPLTDTVRELAQRAWGRGIQDTYGTSECFVMARSCGRFDRMHVQEDVCILEIVDRHYRPVPDGQPGEKVLVTNLFNHVQPFIRYEISDVTGISTGECCGLPFATLLPVEGRTDDIFYVDRPGGGYEAVHPYLFLGPIVELDQVREYQLAQTGRNEVTFKYVPVAGEDAIDARVREVLLSGMEAAGLAERLELVTRQMTEIPRDAKSGKYRQIVSTIGAPEDLDEREKMDH